MFSSKNGNSAPFYYIAHPYEAYAEGYHIHLGTAYEANNDFHAYNYFLPGEVAKLIPVINDYFHTLITETKVHPERMRKKSFLWSIDIALGCLHRVEHMSKQGHTYAIGSKWISPMAWAIIGKDDPPITCYRFHFQNSYALIDYYSRRFAKPCHTFPVCLYHANKSRDALRILMGCSPKNTPLSVNVVMAVAIQFLADLIEYCGPDTTEFFDIFTNDLSCSPDDVDIKIWLKAREKALKGVGTTVFEPERQMGFQMPTRNWTPPQKPKPSYIRVEVTEDKEDNIKAPGVRVKRFLEIERKTSSDQVDEYYKDWYGSGM